MRIDSESSSMKVCDLRSFKIKDIKAQLSVPKDAAFFQLPGVLFISGGVKDDDSLPCKDLVGSLLDGSCLSYEAMSCKRK